MPIGALTNGGARPLTGGAPPGSANDVALGYKELHPEQVRGMIIPMYVALDATTTSGYDTYRVPTTHDLVIEEIRAHLVVTDHANLSGSYTAGDAGIVITANKVLVQSYADRLLLKAANALIDLKNTDREQKIIDNHSTSLAMLHPLAGGEPVRFGTTPQKVIAGESLRLDVRYADAALGNLAGSTQYGIIIVGKLIRVAKS